MKHTPRYTLTGQTLSTGEIIPHQPITVNKLKAGDIVYIEPTTIAPQAEWFRVYDSGNKGLRFWAVTQQFADFLQAYEHECWRLEDEKEDALDDMEATQAQAAGRYGY